MSDLAYLSASEAAARFRDGSLSPVELMQAVIDRANATEPAINAFTYRYDEQALDAARQAELAFAKGESMGPLAGLPVAVKDAGHIAGQPTSGGSLAMPYTPQPQTSPINERVLQAGAIVHARSATPEFSCAAYTWSDRWGITRNPWNPDMTPGGSSGGAGAALAAGSTTLATGSDIGGSIRIPASCCGIVGYKPPHGRNPVDAPFNLDFYCHTGPMARTVGDTILLQNAMCGPHPKDTTTLRPKLHLPTEFAPAKELRIAWSMDLGFFEVDPDVAANTRAALDVFRDLGAQVDEIALPWDWGVIDAALTHLRHIFGTSIAVDLPDSMDKLTSYGRAFAEAGLTVTSQDYYASLLRAGRMAVDFAEAIAGYDLFICPTTALPAVLADFDQSTDRVEINGKTVDAMLGWVMTVPFNMLSRHPVLSVPSGRASNGVPTGIQIVGHSYQDEDVFRAAMSYEAAAPHLFLGRRAPLPM
ncbi:MAG: amidase [Paracoccaceae bacterium]